MNFRREPAQEVENFTWRLLRVSSPGNSWRLRPAFTEVVAIWPASSDACVCNNTVDLLVLRIWSGVRRPLQRRQHHRHHDTAQQVSVPASVPGDVESRESRNTVQETRRPRVLLMERNDLVSIDRRGRC